MSDHDAPEAQEATASQFRSLWGGFKEELPPRPTRQILSRLGRPPPGGDRRLQAELAALQQGAGIMVAIGLELVFC